MRKVTVKNYREDKYYPKVARAVAAILERQNEVVPIEVFTRMGMLESRNVERWKRGELRCLEQVIQGSLPKLGRILRILRFHAHDLKLGPRIVPYRHGTNLLQFSRSGNLRIEEAYARHFVVIGKGSERRAAQPDRGGDALVREMPPGESAPRTGEDPAGMGGGMDGENRGVMNGAVAGERAEPL